MDAPSGISQPETALALFAAAAAAPLPLILVAPLAARAAAAAWLPFGAAAALPLELLLLQLLRALCNDGDRSGDDNDGDDDNNDDETGAWFRQIAAAMPQRRGSCARSCAGLPIARSSLAGLRKQRTRLTRVHAAMMRSAVVVLKDE